MMKADREAAYKKLPIDPSDQPFVEIALRRPSDGKWSGFTTRTLVFGAVAAVLHYNFFPRAITAVINRAFGVPMVFFFDDFAALVQLIMVDKALEVFSKFLQLVGIGLKTGKSSACNQIPFLGLLGSSPCSSNGFQLSISLTPEKREKWPGLIRTYLDRGELPHRCLDKMVGRLSFSQTALFGKFARTQLRPLCSKLQRRVYNDRLSALERDTLLWLHGVIAEFTPRLAIPLPSRADWLIYTDAASGPPYDLRPLIQGRLLFSRP